MSIAAPVYDHGGPMILPQPGSPAVDRDRGEADAVLVVQRVGHELAGLSAAVEELQGALGPALASAAAGDPGMMRQAQGLDLVAQSLEGLSLFLAAVGRLRVGREPLDIEGVASTLKLASLGDRLAGRTPGAESGEMDLF